MYICISDIHLGHIRVNAELIYNKLVLQLYPHLSECKGLFIAGDFFDQLINMDSSGAHYATKVVNDLIQLAGKSNFFIRVLRGTFTHDRRQLKLFETIGTYYPNIDLKYFDTISVENIMPDNLKVLYLPDSLPFKSADTVMEHVRELLKANQLSKVDLVIGHGYFSHVLPKMAANLTKIVYTHDMFDDIVNGYVVFGHVHTHSAYKKVVYCGSFDRLAHGEEEPKGFLKITKDPTWKCKFIENLYSMPFVSIKIPDNIVELPDILKYITDAASKKMNTEEVGHLRIIVKDQDTKVAVLSRISYILPKLNITIKISDDSRDEPVVLATDMFDQIDMGSIPTEETLIGDIVEFLNKWKPDSELTEEVIVQKISALQSLK